MLIKDMTFLFQNYNNNFRINLYIYKMFLLNRFILFSISRNTLKVNFNIEAFLLLQSQRQDTAKKYMYILLILIRHECR